MAGDLTGNEFPRFEGAGSPPDEPSTIRRIHRYGRVSVMAAPANVDSDLLAAASVGAGAGAPADLTTIERLGLEALARRESASYVSAKRERWRSDAQWSGPRCCTSVAGRATAALVVPVAALPDGPSPTSAALEGSVAVGTVIVNGPTDDLRFTDAEIGRMVAEVQNGLGFFAMANPAAALTFIHDVRAVDVSTPADRRAADLEAVWRDPAVDALGHRHAGEGVMAHAEHLRNGFGSRWTFVVFFTKYPVERAAYASLGGPYLVIDAGAPENGGDNLDRVVAHETAHIFGCPDERPTTADPAGPRPSCLMGASTFSLCADTVRQLGWSPRLALRAFGHRAGGWRVDQHLRAVADTTGNGRADLIGFADDGVWISRARPDGVFSAPERVMTNFGSDSGGWSIDRHPRLVVDTTGDGRADIVGFGSGGVWIARAQPNATFSDPMLAVADFGSHAGGWRVDRHPRFLADTTGDGRADIVGFADDGVWISRAQADGSYGVPSLAVAAFGHDAAAGGWTSERHLRMMADTTGDGRADIVGFGDDGVWISRATSDGTYTDPVLAVGDFGFDHGSGGWRREEHPRLVVDTTGDGRADIVGFGDAGVWLSLARRDGTYGPAQLVVAGFGRRAGGWRVDRHVRTLADTTGDGRADVVGFGDAGVWVARGRGGGAFDAPALVAARFGADDAAGGWLVDRHPRVMADTTGDGRADVVGFGDDGVWIMAVT